MLAESWPGVLVSLLSLNVPVEKAFVPTRFHRYFNLLTKANVIHPWTPDCHGVVCDFPDTTTFFVSGSLEMVTTMLRALDSGKWVVACVENVLQGTPPAKLSKLLRQQTRRLSELGLRVLRVKDVDFGGATTAEFNIGFSRETLVQGCSTVVDEPAVPRPPLNVRRQLRHYLEGSEEVFRSSVAKSELEAVSCNWTRPLWLTHGSAEAARGEGLFPAHKPRACVLAPIHKWPSRMVIRPLSLKEFVQLYQLPSTMSFDPTTYGPDLGWRALPPFVNSPSPVVFASILRQLWGRFEGGETRDNKNIAATSVHVVDSGIGNDDENADNISDVEEDRPRWASLGEAEDDVLGDDQGNVVVKQESEVLSGFWAGQGMTSVGDDYAVFTESERLPAERVEKTSHSSATQNWNSTQNLTSEEDELSVATNDSLVNDIWNFELEEGFCPRRTDSDESSQGDRSADWSEVSVDSGDTMRLDHCTKLIFAVGDVVQCEFGEERKLACVVEADHPRYVLQDAVGEVIDTSTLTVTLIPFARHTTAVPEFDVLKQTLLNKGSFGVQIDAQHETMRRISEEKQHRIAQSESFRKIKEAKQYTKAVKADDAEVPEHLWNWRIDQGFGFKAGTNQEGLRDQTYSAFRKFGWRLFIKGLRHDCAEFLVDKYGKEWSTRARKTSDGKLTELGRDQHAIMNIIWHATHTNWFEFKAGSKLVHLRFPVRYQKIARDGVPVFFEKQGPTSKKRQPSIPNPELRAKVREKVEKVLKRRYMVRSGLKIKSLIKYFPVPKGEDDVRIVYDATANDLNDRVWAPSFWLPSIHSLVRALDKDCWMTDRDVGEMFHNFQLHYRVLPYTGVDLAPLYEGVETTESMLAHWDRCLMGFRSSPYNSVKMLLIIEEVVKGDRHDSRTDPLTGVELNPFNWESVRLNLPGPGYDPRLPWVSKIRESDGRVACDVLTFVDDQRATGPDENLTWQASSTLAKKEQYLGGQDAARKVRPPTQYPGAWAGHVVHVVDKLGVCVTTSEEKWNKLKAILTKWMERVQAGDTKLSHKELISDRGFLVYVTQAFPSMVPYLKGFHLTIEMWRGGRDLEGWKVDDDDASSIASDQSLGSLDDTRAGSHGLNLDRASTCLIGQDDETPDEAVYSHVKSAERAPRDGHTTAVPRLKTDLEALIKLSESTLPAFRVVRPAQVFCVYYGFGDAAGKGFGSTVTGYDCDKCFRNAYSDGDDVRYRVGVWTADEEKESSNYKEFTNLVEMAEEEAELGRLRDCEFFLCTDNSTAESCFFRGSSKSKKLHELVVRLRVLEMKYGITIHLIHVAGTRMIAQGTDGCSRGFLMEGVLRGEKMLSFVDLGKSAMERHPPLVDWVRGWTQRQDLEPLTPEEWYREGHGITGGEDDRHGVWIPTHGPGGKLFLWAPPPAAADAALEELLKARHKRTDTFHVITIPRLMAPMWRKLFNKVSDFTFVVSPGAHFWPDSMYEPVWVGVVLPFAHCKPWQLKRAPKLVGMGRELRRVLEAGEDDGLRVLRELLALPRRLAAMPEDMVSGLLQMPRSRNVPHDCDSR